MGNSVNLTVVTLLGALLWSAREEFAVHGHTKVIVGRIATGAGISKKTIYKHVGSKEGLQFSVLKA